MRKRAWVAWMLIVAMMITLWPASVGYALERPVVYPEMNDGYQSEYPGETERVRVYDNGEKKKVDVMTVPVDEVQALVWRPVNGASYYLYSIRDVDNDEPVIVNEQTTNYWITLADMLDWDGPLEYDVTYKIAAAACTSPDDCYWSTEPFYFQLVETVQPEETETPEPEVRFSGSFDQKRIELTVGDVTTVSGRVHVEGDTLNRVTYQIDGWDGDDGNNRYCSQELRGQVGVELSQMNQLVLDTNREPLNVPGEYTLRLVASVESGEWEKLASMTVVVKAADEPTHSATAEPTETPIIEWTVTPEPQTVLSGAFASDYIELNIGDVTTVGGSVNCTGSTLNRVTYQIEGWAGDDGNNRYCTQEVQNVTSVDLSQMNQLVLDTNRAPLNVPGEYKLWVVASAENGVWNHLASMTVVVKAAGEPTHSVTDAPTTPEPQTVLSGAFASDYIELNIGDVTTVGGSVNCTGSTLNRVTYQIEGWAGDDGNNRYCTQEVQNVTSVDLSQMNQLVLDTNRAPLNVPGEYKLWVVASAENGVWNHLASMTVVVKATGEPTHSVTEAPTTPAPVTPASVTPTPATPAPATPAPATSAPATSAPVPVVGGWIEGTEYPVSLGAKMQLQGLVQCMNGTLERITYRIAGYGLENDVYCALELSNGVNEVNLAEQSALELDTNRAPLNAPGTYTLELLAKPVGGDETWPDEVTVKVRQYSNNSDYAMQDYDVAFQKPSTQESAILAKQSVKLASAAYDGLKCYKMLVKMGFNEIEYYNYNNYSKNTVGIIIGYRDIPDENGTMKRVFAVALRGSNTPDDWLSNFTVGDKDRIYPEGFDVTTKNTWNNILTYIVKYNDAKYGSSAASWNDCKVWITGHSRAGAIANLLCGRELFDSGIAFENIYGYTFAAPNVVKVNKIKAVAYVYNYINEGDFIPELPLSIWGYRRYGVDRVLSDGLNNQGFKRIFKEALQAIAPDIETYNSIFEKAVEFGELFRDYMDIDFPACFILGFIGAHPVLSGALTATVANGILYLKPGITGSHYLNQLAKQLGIDVDDNMDVQTIFDEFAKKLEKMGEAHSYDTYLRSVEAYSNALK